MLERFTDAARHAIATAGDLARAAGSGDVAPVHLLGGLAADVGAVGTALQQAGVTPDHVLAAARRLSGARGPAPGRRTAFTPEASSVIEGSLRVSRERDAARIDTADLLVALLRRPAPDVEAVLAGLGVDPGGLRRAVGPGGGQEPPRPQDRGPEADR